MYRGVMQGVNFINPDSLARSNAFSYGIAHFPGSRVVETGGINGTGDDGRIEDAEDLGAQTQKALANALEVLRQAGARKEHIFRLRIYVVDGIDPHPGFAAWQEFWSSQNRQPLVTVTRVHSLVVTNALIELELQAAIPYGDLNDDATVMWEQFLIGSEEGRIAVANGARPAAWAFGYGVDLENELATLVVSGSKRATASSLRVLIAAGEQLPAVGDYSIIYDGARNAKCIIRTDRLFVAPLESVTEEFARREGEGDSSRDYWLAAHRRFFESEHRTYALEFNDQIPVMFEEFRVVWPTEIADDPQNDE